ncbi:MULTISPECIES: DNA topoisomerase (ATP-hydrolyzing) subunit A [unclassified Synechocystis]|uniref:DNA topoisomerase 4 subunit A n=1 Tax=Synechocystis sp. (strain ATCC 27184 / PCC 6803 / Kazusa) TaxID=1111708 RepID=PARC_SYNY3|nr:MULTISPECIES: DNA topoisomerase (ATP-hydrolyzing) subunit A [unclassified Synechocystis]P73077.2 RecName: Full=DNA topoisomerase 4 subunit A; AltName: Full=Topoisomerase IV subunit A [Synechocystis sp. PCC 6803 substr. Kazusa]BAM50819.1 DNA gyrase A subunit [Synechocystis sp. PCC 6803] [Bacillus subtilis BEST7613]ALJ66843.1 DNA topoisomerase [Synechocystis sp. PCC 6803]AVP88689.1 DNA topoisomerase 4 subunit A [Synechocystis sp. IPPAS B-1465]MBD2619816.1 DNA topoisomerase 4 subunit A [Synech
MARKSFPSGQIIPTDLHEEMERSYLEYAMSVIVGRALPDVRDGLKPVHRRILYAMYELGLTPDRPFRKCARVVGDVLGKYHPHGDQSVYDALVRMVQDFSSRYPLLAGHGNFGSVDNDPPAAMRYTETRLAPIAMGAMLEGISEAIVDFTGNFDNSQEEPTVVPAQLPLLLLNGCSGIAVGMATSIPPHNLGEVVDGLIGLINKPDLSDQELFKLIPGPDFPTGGHILDSEGILQAYQTGRGLIPVRGVSHIETIRGEKKRSHNRTAIVITELPFQVNKAAWIEKIASLVNDGKLDGISDLRDESDRTGMRVVIELKRDAEPNAILQKLYRMTPLQSNFGVIFLALVNNQPVQMSLRQILQEFLQFREDTLLRQYENELGENRRRLELLTGLLIGLENLDALIEILRFAADGTTAKIQLQERLGISLQQGDAILGMPMRRITGLEREKLQQEHTDLAQRIEQLETLIGDRQERLKALKKELRGLKKKFADERRTKILQGMPAKIEPLPVNQDPLPEATIPPVESQSAPEEELDSPGEPEQEQLVLENSSPPTADSAPEAKQDDLNLAVKPTPKTVKQEAQPSPEVIATHSKLVSVAEKNPLTLFTPQTPPAEAFLSINLQGEIAWHPEELTSANSFEPLDQQFSIQGRETLIVIGDHGKAFPVAIADIPPLAVTRIPLLQILPKSAQRDATTVTFQGFLPPPEQPQDLLLVSQQGRVKLLAGQELQELGPRGLSLMKLKNGDLLQFAQLVTPVNPASAQNPGKNLVIATSNGRLLRFDPAQVGLTCSSPSAQGQEAMRLRATESLVGVLMASPGDRVLLLTQAGYGKQLDLASVRLGNFGELGTTVMQFTSKADRLLTMVAANQGAQSPQSSTYDFYSNQQRLHSVQADQFQPWGKDGFGDRLVDLNEGEHLITQVAHLG